MRALSIAAVLVLALAGTVFARAMIQQPPAIFFLCNGLPCPEANTIIAASVGTKIDISIATDDVNKPITAYWIFGNGKVQDGGLIASTVYTAPGKYTMTIYIFYEQELPVTFTKTVLITAANNTKLLSDNTVDFVQRLALFATAVMTLVGLLYQIFIPA